MKVVLFCGGLGMRIREAGENVPKPMVTIGYRPILWHVMKYYAHYGHKDFVLCLGYRGDVIKNYFLNYSECAVERLRAVGRRQEAGADEAATFTTGRSRSSRPALTSNIGQRLKAVERYVRRRAGVPRQLQRRPVRSAAAGAHRSFPAAATPSRASSASSRT